MDRNICKFSVTRSSDLVCSDFVYETANTLAKPRVSRKYLLGLVMKGDGTLTKNGTAHALTEGSLFAVEAEQAFSIDGAEMEYCYITFSGRRASELAERMGLSPSLCVFSGYTCLCEFWLDSLHRADDGNLDLLAEAVLLYSVAQLKPEKKAHGDLVTRMMAVTDEQFTNASFSLSRLADKLGYDAKYLSSLFRQKKGIPFTQYLRDLRIRHAIFLMEQGVVSVKNTAILSGFSDALYFSKIFKVSVGVSPKAYIEGLQAKE